MKSLWETLKMNVPVQFVSCHWENLFLQDVDTGFVKVASRNISEGALSVSSNEMLIVLFECLISISDDKA